MSEEGQPEHSHQLPWYRQSIVLFVGASIVIAGILVIVSMALYDLSGAAQLDLSRPGYKSVQSKLDQTGSFESFQSNGKVNEQIIDEFQELFDKQTKSIDNTDAFSPSALDPQTLGIDAPAASE
jgi:hypothetical protein